MNIIIEDKVSNEIEVGDIVRTLWGKYFYIVGYDAFRGDGSYVLVSLRTGDIKSAYDSLDTLEKDCVLSCKNEDVTVVLGGANNE